MRKFTDLAGPRAVPWLGSGAAPLLATAGAALVTNTQLNEGRAMKRRNLEIAPNQPRRPIRRGLATQCLVVNSTWYC